MSDFTDIKDSKQEAINHVQSLINEFGFMIAEKDFDRPWGGFFRLNNNEAEKFIDTYFADIKDTFTTFEDLSPKYLIVESGKRLSWQYHYRRAEIWRAIEGTVGVKLSDNNIEPEKVHTIEKGETIQFPALKRHRLIGLGGWGVVVEIWQHTDHQNLSDESDIVRVADDFGR